MRSKATARFWTLYSQLPYRTKCLVDKAYRLWCLDHSHPSLHFKKLRGTHDLFSVRVGDHHRAVGLLKDDLVIWVWVGTHQGFDALLWR